MRFRRPLVSAVAVAAACLASVIAPTVTPAGAAVPHVVAPNPAIGGAWSAVTKLPLPPAHMAVLPNGKILMWVFGTPTATYVWDPVTNELVRRMVRGTNLMCAGFVQLSDGRVLVVGGQGKGATEGTRNTYLFDWRTNTWSKGPLMAAKRWYPSVAALPDGGALIMGGGPVVPEVYQPNGTIRELTTASYKPNRKRYPFLQSLPDGQVGYFGHDVGLRSLDTSGTGHWTLFGNRDSISRLYGSYAMYDIGKVLVAGGGDVRAYPTNTASVVTAVGDTLVGAPTGSLTYGRRQGHLTVLADGTVLFSGGQSSKFAEEVDLKHPVLAPERWDPATGSWTVMASPRVTRQYHSTAVLLPDGRVLTAGGGFCAGCGVTIKYNAKSAEIYSPPYLFDANGQPAVRPVITSAPATASPGNSYGVDVTSSTGVSKMALVRLAAETHAQDQGQRYVPLAVTPEGGSTYQATVPGDHNILPPGFYMLFAIDGNGVPSVSSMVQIV